MYKVARESSHNAISIITNCLIWTNFLCRLRESRDVCLHNLNKVRYDATSVINYFNESLCCKEYPSPRCISTCANTTYSYIYTLVNPLSDTYWRIYTISTDYSPCLSGLSPDWCTINSLSPCQANASVNCKVRIDWILSTPGAEPKKKLLARQTCMHYKWDLMYCMRAWKDLGVRSS